MDDFIVPEMGTNGTVCQPHCGLGPHNRPGVQRRPIPPIAPAVGVMRGRCAGQVRWLRVRIMRRIEVQSAIMRAQAQIKCPGFLTMMLKLDEFLPYRLSVLSNHVSQGIAKTYTERFDLSVTEWRVLAILGLEEGLSATEVAARSAMDKVAVSRAVKRLIGAKRLTRQADQADGRAKSLFLTDVGRQVYETIAPAAMAYEKRLIAVLSDEELVQFNAVLDRLMAHTEQPEDRSTRGGETG